MVDYSTAAYGCVAIFVLVFVVFRCLDFRESNYKKQLDDASKTIAMLTEENAKIKNSERFVADLLHREGELKTKAEDQAYALDGKVKHFSKLLQNCWLERIDEWTDYGKKIESLKHENEIQSKLIGCLNFSISGLENNIKYWENRVDEIAKVANFFRMSARGLELLDLGVGGSGWKREIAMDLGKFRGICKIDRVDATTKPSNPRELDFTITGTMRPSNG